MYIKVRLFFIIAKKKTISYKLKLLKYGKIFYIIYITTKTSKAQNIYKKHTLLPSLRRK